MGQVLHRCARTTEAVRRAIQHSQKSLNDLAEQYGINPKTVAKWKKRGDANDAPMGPKQVRSTVLTSAEEAAVVAFRKYTLLPLDDCLYALQPSIPHLTRSSLHRCFQRHGISRLPEVEGDRPKRQKFACYPIGYFHIDIAEVQTEEGKLYMFVAVDRTSKFVYGELHPRATRMIAKDFLDNLTKVVPYKIHTILTDNGIQFAKREGTEAYWIIPFDRLCAALGIEHRLTKINHPWTTDVIDKCFLFRFAIFSCHARVTAWQRARCEVRSLPRSLYRSSSFAAPVRAFDGPRGVQLATKRTEAASACSTKRRSCSRWPLML
jgi:hypothetical protein